MLASSGGNVRALLDDILAHAASHPESEPLIRRAFSSLREALADSSALADLTIRSLPAPLPNPKQTSRKARTPPPSDDLSEFGLALQQLIGAPRKLQLKDLIRIADEVGPKHGKFPSQGDRRAKGHILRWLRDNYDLFYPSLRLLAQHDDAE
jgi:hypothetical protein